MVSGVVSETVNGVVRPLAGHDLDLTIHETEGLPQGLTLRGSWQPAGTDQNGRFEVRVPRSRVFVSVRSRRQPCIASAPVNRDTTIDVQVFPLGGSVGPPLPPASPMITGLVYEITAGGRKPLRGAEAWLDLGQDNYIANTVTDDEGRFYFCHVDARVRMDVLAYGYQPYQYAELISGVGDRSFEFEFRR